MLVTRGVWVLLLALPNHMTLRLDLLFCKMRTRHLPLRAVLKHRWDYILEVIFPLHLHCSYLWSFGALWMSYHGNLRCRDYAQRKGENQSLTNSCLLLSFLVFPWHHQMSDLRCHMSPRILILWRQSLWPSLCIWRDCWPWPSPQSACDCL